MNPLSEHERGELEAALHRAIAEVDLAAVRAALRDVRYVLHLAALPSVRSLSPTHENDHELK